MRTPPFAYAAESIDPMLQRRRDAISGVDSSTFGEGVRLLPEKRQRDIRQLYYVLRAIDDLVDEAHPLAAVRVAAVEDWALGRQVDTPETEILRDLAARYPFPVEAIVEFCQGMRHDLAGGTIETEADLERYCQHAGGAVGVMLARLLGTTCAEAETRMATLGRAMQRTNILRDIDEDLKHGRVYLARTTIDRFGCPAPGEREELLRDQIARADALYDQGLPAIDELVDGRAAMRRATSLYRGILRRLERDEYAARTKANATGPAHDHKANATGPAHDHKANATGPAHDHKASATGPAHDQATGE